MATDDDVTISLQPVEPTATAAMALSICIGDDVRRQITDFANTDTTRELGGILIGMIEEGESTTVSITAMVPARYTQAVEASITFTHETWQDLLAVKDREYPEQRIVGWFHTHPGFGIFLSRRDLFIHQHFFNLDWQVAYVIDPLTGREGFFRWHNGHIVQIVGNEP